jgi:ABC-type multidrug transport system fused ATPase/permease subunit
MEELDLLKKDWKKKENSFSQLSETEIYNMIHRKSSSIVKWILIISILEVLLWTVIGIVYSSDEYLKSMKHEELLVYFRALNFLNYAVVLVFIWLFYKNYVNISTTSSTKKLMKDILKTRKTVQYYVWYNVVMMILGLIAGFVLAFSYDPNVNSLKEKMMHETKYMIIIIAVLTLVTVVIGVIFWLFYRLLYGILLRRLQANYKELKKIDL